MIGNGTAATEIDEFTAGDEIGIGTCSGEVCQRQTPTAAPRRLPIRLFAAFLFGFNRNSREWVGKIEVTGLICI